MTSGSTSRDPARSSTGQPLIGCWLISPMDVDSSSAAAAAVSTLSEALLDPATAPSARSEFMLEAANSVVAVERISEPEGEEEAEGDAGV